MQTGTKLRSAKKYQTKKKAKKKKEINSEVI